MSTAPKKAKIFDFDRHADAPQIPRVQDVLFVMLRSETDEYYRASRKNNDTRYLLNVGKVVVAVGMKVGNLEPYDENTARRIIARAIVDLCPEEAACLRREAYIVAKRLAGDDVPSKDANVHERCKACICQECRTSSSTD